MGALRTALIAGLMVAGPGIAAADVTAAALAALIDDLTGSFRDEAAAIIVVDCGLQQLNAEGEAALNAAKTPEERDVVMSAYVDVGVLQTCAEDAFP